MKEQPTPNRGQSNLFELPRCEGGKLEELDRPLTYILDDVKETVITENTYRVIPYEVLMTYFLPQGWF